MVKKEEVEQLMLRYFPSCPLCGTNTGYKVSFNRLIVQCRSCGAKWQSNDFMGGKEIRTLQLRKPDKKGKSKFLVKKTKSVSFWQSLDLEHERERERIEKEIEELFRKLKTKDPKVRSEIQNRLREIGQPVFLKIGEMAKFSHWPARREALWLLGLMEDERGQELLIEALKKDEKEEVRFQAIISLVLIEKAKKTGKAIGPLIETLKNDKSIVVRATAARALGEMKSYPRVINALILALNDTESQTVTKGSIFGEYVAGYITVRNNAMDALRKIGDKRGIAALVSPAIQVLKMQNWKSREWAAAFLGDIGDAQAVKPLIDALKDEHWKVRRTTAKALGKIRDVEAVEPLAQALNDESRDVRMKALEALGKIGEPAVESLIQALKHKDTSIQQKAAYVLGDIGDARALEALTQAKEDKSWNVRSAAKEALKKIQKK